MMPILTIGAVLVYLIVGVHVVRVARKRGVSDPKSDGAAGLEVLIWPMLVMAVAFTGLLEWIGRQARQ